MAATRACMYEITVAYFLQFCFSFECCVKIALTSPACAVICCPLFAWSTGCNQVTELVDVL